MNRSRYAQRGCLISGTLVSLGTGYMPIKQFCSFMGYQVPKVPEKVTPIHKKLKLLLITLVVLRLTGD